MGERSVVLAGESPANIIFVDIFIADFGRLGETLEPVPSVHKDGFGVETRMRKQSNKSVQLTKRIRGGLFRRIIIITNENELRSFSSYQ